MADMYSAHVTTGNPSKTHSPSNLRPLFFLIMTDPNLRMLASAAIQKRISPLAFLQLFHQLNAKHPVSAADYADFLRATDGDEGLRARYVLALALHSYGTCGNLLDMLRSLARSPPVTQTLVLTGLLRRFADAGLGTVYAAGDVMAALAGYLETADEAVLGVCANFLLALHAMLDERAGPFPDATARLCDAVARVSSALRTRDPHTARILTAKYAALQQSAQSSYSTQGSLKSAVPKAPTSSSANSAAKARRLLWLSPMVHQWQTAAKNFLVAFENALKIQSPFLLVTELVAAAFDGYAITRLSNRTTLATLAEQNWRLFVTKKLPLLIRELGIHGAETTIVGTLAALDPKVVKVLKKAADANDDFMNLNTDDSLLDDDEFNSFPSTSRDIRHDFVVACAQLGLMLRDVFRRLAQEKHLDVALDDDNWSASPPMDLAAEFARTLNVNAELVSFEDSMLTEFLQGIPRAPLGTQNEFVEVLLTTIGQLVKDSSLVALHRLCLGLATVPEVLDIVVALQSPRALLVPLVRVVDSWNADAEDMNFQDTYTDFGCVLLLVIFVCKRYQTSPSDDSSEGGGVSLVIGLDDGSSLTDVSDGSHTAGFTRDYLANLGAARYASLCDVPVPLSDISSDDKLNELLGGWIAALFESGAISDDLMGQTTAKECYELIPLLFQQAVSACERQIIDLEVLKSGLEYFLQPFLLVTIIGIFRLLRHAFWALASPGANDDARAQLLLSIVGILSSEDELAGESKLVHKVVLQIVGTDLAAALTEFKTAQPLLIAECSPLIERLSLDGNPHQTRSYLMEYLGQSTSVNTPIYMLGTQFHQLLGWCLTNHSLPAFDPSLVPLLADTVGYEKVLLYFLKQMDHVCASENLLVGNKNLMLVVNLAVSYVLSYSGICINKVTRESWLQFLKHGDGSGDALFTAFASLKSRLDATDSEIVALFIEKLTDAVEHAIPVN
ncbi:hypothetical protein BABINDRAFT_175328 [Babjeviella inositovora NRRL Y-12698]|uniref:Mediator of RNA polymerase II transcription subunit 5 n=1 Tax=Babjeviella inositovora NRRL Y-12698 TaxID=984486 RepID=A0A1E3QSH7_9ASCO|nr:uncharacterized protein BABINDRAFT_175328 [Babjeviella inositovora NRRL Y-12698]ODQ80655.1 hypothetical protein BABINDRAFT_175328 [Babjeviella inositovora NRRL Y-12698]